MKVIIKSISYEDKYDIREMTIVEIDGEKICDGRYGGEPEDNLRCRDYDWVEKALELLAKKLGAEIEIQNIEGEEAQKYFE